MQRNDFTPPLSKKYALWRHGISEESRYLTPTIPEAMDKAFKPTKEVNDGVWV